MHRTYSIPSAASPPPAPAPYAPRPTPLLPHARRLPAQSCTARPARPVPRAWLRAGLPVRGAATLRLVLLFDKHQRPCLGAAPAVSLPDVHRLPHEPLLTP